MTDKTETAWYPTNCPQWCEGKHPCLLAVHDPDADEVIVHARKLTDSSDDAPTVEIEQTEAHPASPYRHMVTGPRVRVYLPDAHESTGTDPAQLHIWASVLADAATRAESIMNGSRP